MNEFSVLKYTKKKMEWEKEEEGKEEVEGKI